MSRQLYIFPYPKSSAVASGQHTVRYGHCAVQTRTLSASLQHVLTVDHVIRLQAVDSTCRLPPRYSTAAAGEGQLQEPLADPALRIALPFATSRPFSKELFHLPAALLPGHVCVHALKSLRTECKASYLY